MRAHWRLIIDGPATGASNMAVDEALFESVQAGGQPVLRLYRWQPGCLSLGRNQAAAGFDPRIAAARGIDIVRRPTGGLAVYHDRELTYAAALPARLLGGPRATYIALNDALARGLRRLRIDADRVSRSDPPQPVAAPVNGATRAGTHPCFEKAAHGEIGVGGRKLVGSAQRCVAHTVLQHGSILIGGDQSEVLQLEQRDPVDTSCTSLEALLGRAPAEHELELAIRSGFEDELQIAFDAGTLTCAETARARVLAERYRSGEWTWRH